MRHCLTFSFIFERNYLSNEKKSIKIKKNKDQYLCTKISTQRTKSISLIIGDSIFIPNNT